MLICSELDLLNMLHCIVPLHSIYLLQHILQSEFQGSYRGIWNGGKCFVINYELETATNPLLLLLFKVLRTYSSI